jgi:putative ABC transport system permease protein
VLVTVDDGESAEAVAATIAAAGLAVGPTEQPSVQVNLSPVRSYPLVVGVVLAVLGLAAMLGGGVGAMRRRRKESATLRAIGLSSSQMFGAVVCETAWTAAVAVVLGVPLGLLAGHRAWATFANRLSLSADLDASWAAAVAVAAGLAGLAVCVSLLPAAFAARRAVGPDLRTE